MLYSNISNDWQNKRASVRHTGGAMQHKEDGSFHTVYWHFIVYHFKSKRIFVFHERISLTRIHLELIWGSLKCIALIYCFALQNERLLNVIVVKCCKKTRHSLTLKTPRNSPKLAAIEVSPTQLTSKLIRCRHSLHRTAL